MTKISWANMSEYPDENLIFIDNEIQSKSVDENEARALAKIVIEDVVVQTG